ncbi:MAG: ABC transporter substrate-binding protein [Peptococcaceae bacterium]|nr:ABC transporter substrate-binding protein [Peptococcaceae bacterium]
MKKLVSIVTIAALAVGLTACGGASDSASTGSASGESSGLKEITLVLDYVPNTNHTGLYVAQDKGYFEDEGLKVNIIEPGDNNTSAALVAAGKGDFGVSYQEDVTYALAGEEPMPIKAIAAVIQHNTSGFVSLADSGIKSPKDFEGKTYAGWQSPSEEAVINAVMTAAGADPDKLTIVGADGNGLSQLGNGVDLLWEFKGWAITKAEMEGMKFNYMPLNELDERLDYYTPVIISNNDMIEGDPETVQHFMNAVKKGYEFAIDNPDESAEILHNYTPDYDLDFLKTSQKYLSAEYAKDAESWGVMKDSVWDNYTSFMKENGLIEKDIPAADQYTNEFVK